MFGQYVIYNLLRLRKSRLGYWETYVQTLYREVDCAMRNREKRAIEGRQ